MNERWCVKCPGKLAEDDDGPVCRDCLVAAVERGRVREERHSDRIKFASEYPRRAS